MSISDSEWLHKGNLMAIMGRLGKPNSDPKGVGFLKIEIISGSETVSPAVQCVSQAASILICSQSSNLICG